LLRISHEATPRTGDARDGLRRTRANPDRQRRTQRAVDAEAELVSFANRPTVGPTCALVIRHDGAVWVDDATELACLPPPGSQSITIAVDVKAFAWRDLISGVPGEAIGPELLLDVSSRRHTGDDTVVARSEIEIVCGTGASGHPACTPPIWVTSQGALAPVAFHPAIATDGTLTFDLDDPDEAIDVRDDYQRKDPLVFP
jgi:hypothetical protein